jgi:hypothetical protein
MVTVPAKLSITCFISVRTSLSVVSINVTSSVTPVSMSWMEEWQPQP